MSVAFRPDGRMLATGSFDRTIRLWDVRTRLPVGQPLTGHTGQVNGVAFSPDGRTLASASADGTVRLWDVRARRPLGQPLGSHAGEVNGVAFGPDGRTLASAGEDGTIRLWDGILWSDDRATIARRICGAVRRSLTPAQWFEFLPREPYH